MNLPEIFKQFKNIEPDATFKNTSKRAILAHQPRESWSARRVIMAIFETGVAVGLTVFFILIVTGLFPTSSYISPAQFSVIDPTSLHAEAQAVDIQIQLAEVNYAEATTTSAGSTPQAASGAIMRPMALSETQAASSTTAANSSSSASSTPSSTTVSVDQALQELTQ